MNTCAYCGDEVNRQKCGSCGASLSATPPPAKPSISERERFAECARLAELIESYTMSFSLSSTREGKAAIKNIIERFQQRFDALMAQQ